MRSFLALDLPAEVQRSLHTHTLEAVAGDAANHLRLIPSENLHVTLVFLGEVAAGRFAAIRDAVAGVEPVGPLQLQTTALDFFPPRGPPRVFVAHLAGDVDRLAAHLANLQAALRPLGFVPERRPFRPHVTLARVRDPRSAPRNVRQIANVVGAAQPFVATTLSLYESTLTCRGAIYNARYQRAV